MSSMLFECNHYGQCVCGSQEDVGGFSCGESGKLAIGNVALLPAGSAGSEVISLALFECDRPNVHPTNPTQM